jgi:hypothetical protein
MNARRSILPIVFVTLLAGSLVAAIPAQAKKSCKPFKPGAPQSPSAEAEEAVDAEVNKVTDKATEKKPLTVEFTQAPGMWADAETAVVEGSEFLNFQVISKSASATLTIHVEWATPTASDIDEYLYASSGSLIAESTAFNPYPPLNESTGGEGFEHITVPVSSCDGLTLESRPFMTAGEAMTLHAWLD